MKTYIDFCQNYEHSNASASAAVIDSKNKRILFAIEDERLLRRKYDLHTSTSRQWLTDRLAECGVDEADTVILDTQGLTNTELVALKEDRPYITGAVRGHYVASLTGEHHLWHALNGYAQSGFEDASILVLDGCDYPEGGASICIFSARGDKIELVKKYPTDRSLGVLYALGCILCGFSWNEGGKLMGLASYGRIDSSRYCPFFLVDERSGDVTIDNGHLWQREYVNEAPSAAVDFSSALTACFIAHGASLEFLETGKPFNFFSFQKASIAALVQKLFEHTLNSLLRYMHTSLPSRNLVLAGGCALNCVANGKILNSGNWKSVYIPSTCDDAGNTFGAAIARYGVRLDKPLIYNRYTYTVPADYSKEITPHEVASRLRSGQVIAWFEGGSEYGPRALCHRSLLANPHLPSTAYRLNEIKDRDYWRPLAPVVLDSYFTVFFETKRIHPPHKLMLAAETIRLEHRLSLPAVCAPNGTARPQVLSDCPENAVLYRLMSENSLPILVNTSMNGRGEPICETPENAINFCDKHPDVLLVFVRDGKLLIKG